MNSKNEWNGEALPRIIVEGKEDKENDIKDNTKRKTGSQVVVPKTSKRARIFGPKPTTKTPKSTPRRMIQKMKQKRGIEEGIEVDDEDEFKEDEENESTRTVDDRKGQVNNKDDEKQEVNEESKNLKVESNDESKSKTMEKEQKKDKTNEENEGTEILERKGNEEVKIMEKKNEELIKIPSKDKNMVENNSDPLGVEVGWGGVGGGGEKVVISNIQFQNVDIRYKNTMSDMMSISKRIKQEQRDRGKFW